MIRQEKSQLEQIQLFIWFTNWFYTDLYTILHCILPLILLRSQIMARMKNLFCKSIFPSQKLYILLTLHSSPMIHHSSFPFSTLFPRNPSFSLFCDYSHSYTKNSIKFIISRFGTISYPFQRSPQPLVLFRIYSW